MFVRRRVISGRCNRLLRLCLALFVLLQIGAKTARADCDLKVGTYAQIRDVVDGDTVETIRGLEVRLVGIQAPKLPLGRRDFQEWPLADASSIALSTLVAGQEVGLAPGGREEDRYGRRLAHMFLPDGTWVQRRMLELGYARVYTFPDNRACVADLLAAERLARRAGRGIWGHPYYDILSANDTAGLLARVDSFQLVEGRVLQADLVRRRMYLNFGEEWKEDFTITASPADARLFERTWGSVDAVEGKRIRVRGWIESFDGPRIAVTHPEQIEILGE